MMMIRDGSYVDGFEPASYYVPYTMYPNKYVSLYYVRGHLYMWLNEVCLNVGATDHIKRQAFSGVAVPKALAGTSYPSTGPALREGAPLTDTAGGFGTWTSVGPSRLLCTADFLGEWWTLLRL